MVKLWVLYGSVMDVVYSPIEGAPLIEFIANKLECVAILSELQIAHQRTSFSRGTYFIDRQILSLLYQIMLKYCNLMVGKCNLIPLIAK